MLQVTIEISVQCVSPIIISMAHNVTEKIFAVLYVT